MTESFESQESPPFPSQDDCQTLALAMARKYALYLGERTFVVACSFDPETQVVTAETVLKNSQESFYYPVTARIDSAAEELTPPAAALFLVDYIDMYFEEYLTTDEATYIPIDWHDYSYDAVKFQMKGQILNRHAERLADQLLQS